MIIVEMEVNLESLSYTFILKVFRDRTWTSSSHEIWECARSSSLDSFLNATVEGDRLNCWVRGTEFTISPSSIQNLLQIHSVTPKSSLPYDDRRTRIAEAIVDLGDDQKRQSIQTMHIVDFSLVLKALAYIMIFNLYPVKNLTILSQPRTLFLNDLFKKEEIDICAHIYSLLAKCV